MTAADWNALSGAIASAITTDVYALIRGAAHEDHDHDCSDEDNVDTFGALVDKLVTVNMKMWHNQEALYEIRRMTESEFEHRWGGNLPGLREVIKRCCDLNVQRGRLIDEIDRFLQEAVAGKKTGDMVREQHKTY